MRILVLNADYPRFLAWFYSRQPGLEDARAQREWQRGMRSSRVNSS